MEYITAPWREEYVVTAGKMKDCVFCCALKKKADQDAHILYRGGHNFILLNKYPYTPGHLMIAPYQHIDSIEKSDKAASDEMTDLLKMTIRILRKHYSPHGFNTGMNIGQSAGAGVTDHYHMHVIPRWTGDANFMPLVGKTKVVIEDLATTYRRLRPLFKDIE